MKTEQDTHEGKQTRKKGYVPDDDKDYQLCGIEIDDAENGVVVNCRYRLKPEVKAKIDAQRNDGISVPYYDSFSGDKEQHVFQDKAEAKNFINGELDDLFNIEGGEGDDNEEE